MYVSINDWVFAGLHLAAHAFTFNCFIISSQFTKLKSAIARKYRSRPQTHAVG